jgi:L,D-peptidoglycan transpeptidase YkuD (ErfK/YbiS/YcfS/YnhG family)
MCPYSPLFEIAAPSYGGLGRGAIAPRMTEPCLELHLLMMKLTIFLACVLAACVSNLPAQSNASGGDVFSRSTEMLVVTTPDWNAVDGQLERFERVSARDPWRPAGAPISIVVGGKGMGWGIGLLLENARTAGLTTETKKTEPIKKEGDGKSPAGVFTLGTAFGDAAQPLSGQKLPYLELTPSIECVDDARSTHYNRVLDRSTVSPDWNNSEHMRSVGEAYRWGIVINHNGTVVGPDSKAPAPGGGSCVFLHIWGGRGHGTAGCTAMTPGDIEALLTWLDPARKPLLVQMPRADYDRLASAWKLPKLADAAAH